MQAKNGDYCMEWSKIYGPDNQPGLDDISNFVNMDLWRELNSYLQQTYDIRPKPAYSKCSMQPGWNLKYSKGGKALCTLYPMMNCFFVLVVIGNREMNEAEFIIPLCSEYIRELYKNTVSSTMGRWLMINVTNHMILKDVTKLIGIRAGSKVNNKFAAFIPHKNLFL